MIRIGIVVFFFSASFTDSAFPRDSTISKLPVDDPSFVPLFREDSVPAFRWRAYGDVNKDGRMDVIVSEDVMSVSQNGLNLFFYFGDSTGKYVFYDSFFESPTGISFERDEKCARVWGYWRVSAGEGIIYYYLMTDSGFVKGDQITVYTSPDGSEIGTAIFNALKNSDVKLTIERYKIVNGHVVIENE